MNKINETAGFRYTTNQPTHSMPQSNSFDLGRSTYSAILNILLSKLETPYLK